MFDRKARVSTERDLPSERKTVDPGAWFQYLVSTAFGESDAARHLTWHVLHSLL